MNSNIICGDALTVLKTLPDETVNNEPMAERYRAAADQLSAQEDARSDLNTRKQASQNFLDALKNQAAAMTEFDEGLWHLLIDTVTVHTGRVVFTFRSGMEIEKAI